VHPALHGEPATGEVVRQDARVLLRVLARRYAAVPVAAGFLALVATVFPSTVRLAASGPLTTGPSRLAAPSAGAAPSVRLSSSASAAPVASGTGLGVPSTAASSQQSGAGVPSAPTGGSAPLGEAPISETTSPGKIPQAPAGPSSASCPLPTVAPPGPVVPQVYALLQALTGLCAVAASVPGLAAQLPAILAALPSDLASGQLPPQVDQLIQQIAFQVLIPLVSVLPLPSSPASASGAGGPAALYERLLAAAKDAAGHEAAARGATGEAGGTAGSGLLVPLRGTGG
jgi:hypothetical protein